MQIDIWILYKNIWISQKDEKEDVNSKLNSKPFFQQSNDCCKTENIREVNGDIMEFYGNTDHSTEEIKGIKIY